MDTAVKASKAGTSTCNYDGANKFKTIIEDDVFIGSDTQLVAPVTVGRGATLGAGTTLTKDAPPHHQHDHGDEARQQGQREDRSQVAAAEQQGESSRWN